MVTVGERVRGLESQLEALRVRIAMVSIERRVLADRLARTEGDVALLGEELRRVGAELGELGGEVREAKQS